MQKYKNLRKISGVIGYQYGPDYIIVNFKSGKHRFYRYDLTTVSEETLERLQHLADLGSGLNSALHKKNRINYSKKGNTFEDVA